MITVSQIRDGSGYLKNHLSSNDYYSEGETVQGQWQGKAAWMLGLEGKVVEEKDFQALRTNRHPRTGEKLRPRSATVAFHDFVISAPKSASIAAMVGGDERVTEAFDRCALRAFQRLEGFAAVRVRKGKSYHTEEFRRTGNAVAAAFRHDTSRLLDPQLHTHFVFANLSWDEKSQRWLALQPKEMAVQSKEWIRGKFYREFAQECRDLGYAVEKDGEAFRLSGMDRSIEHAFSQRTLQRERFESRYEKLFGKVPDKKRIEQFIKDHKGAATRRFKEEYEAHFRSSPSQAKVAEFVQDWRSSKMAKATTEQVRALQRNRMTGEQSETLGEVVRQSRERPGESGAIAKPKRIEESPDVGAAPVGEKSKLSHSSDGTRVPKSQKKAGESRKEIRKKKLGHQEAMRRLKKGMTLGASVRSHPMAQAARRLQQLAKRSHGTQRRIY